MQQLSSVVSNQSENFRNIREMILPCFSLLTVNDCTFVFSAASSSGISPIFGLTSHASSLCHRNEGP